MLEAADTHGAATACMPHDAPIGRLGDGYITLSDEDAHLRTFQTPRAIRRDVWLEPRDHATTAGLDICTPYRIPFVAVTGAESNIKITTELDWDIAHDVIAPRLGLA